VHYDVSCDGRAKCASVGLQGHEKTNNHQDELHKFGCDLIDLVCFVLSLMFRLHFRTGGLGCT
jgi:hypothetical protein